MTTACVALDRCNLEANYVKFKCVLLLRIWRDPGILTFFSADRNFMALSVACLSHSRQMLQLLP